MKRLLLGGVISGFLAALPLMALPISPISQTPIPPFSGAGATGVVASSAIDVSQDISSGVQVWCNPACVGTTVLVEIRSTSTAPWYTAATCAPPPTSGTIATTCYVTLPVAKDMRIDMTVYGGAGNVFAIYNSRTS